MVIKVTTIIKAAFPSKRRMFGKAEDMPIMPIPGNPLTCSFGKSFCFFGSAVNRVPFTSFSEMDYLLLAARIFELKIKKIGVEFSYCFIMFI